MLTDGYKAIYILKSNARGICAFFFGIILYRLYRRFENSIKYILEFGWLSFIIFIVAACFYGIDVVVGNLQMTIIYYFSPLFVISGCYISKYVVNKNIQQISNFLGNISFYIFFIHFWVLMFIQYKMNEYLTIDYTRASVFCVFSISSILLSVVYKYMIKEIQSLIKSIILYWTEI